MHAAERTALVLHELISCTAEAAEGPERSVPVLPHLMSCSNVYVCRFNRTQTRVLPSVLYIGLDDGDLAGS
jgi:hypothetical protein